jgi:flagellar hook-associated protein 3 FlgL
MRISENMMTNSILKGINANKSRMNEIQLQLSSGKRIQKSSDDPFAFAKSARFKSIIERNDQYLRSINMSLGFVESTQIHLDDINSIIQNAKEKATQGADDSLNAENREALAQEVSSMLEELESIANGNFDGDFVFNGDQVNQQPFQLIEDPNNPGFYIGVNSPDNPESMDRKFGDHLNIQINISGNDIQNINQAFNDLIGLQNALSEGWEANFSEFENQSGAISSQIDKLDLASENILKLSTKIGDVHSRITLTEQQLTLTNMNLSSYMSSLEDVDMAEAILHYNSEEMAYKVALQATSNMMTTSLMDYIR